jgi:hypothetical protein
MALSNSATRSRWLPLKLQPSIPIQITHEREKNGFIVPGLSFLLAFEIRLHLEAEVALKHACVLAVWLVFLKSFVYEISKTSGILPRMHVF